MKLLERQFLLLMLYLSSFSLQGQPAYDMRFRLATLDTLERTACFNIELRNSGDVEWILSNYNVAIFYDTSAACYSSASLVLEDIIYDPSITNIETSATGTPLPYESSLGFIRAGLAANAPGVIMDTAGTWVPTIQLCFDIKLQNITDPNTSFQVNFNSEELRPFIGVPPNIVQEWNPNVFISDVMAGTVYDNNPAPTLSSSFVIEENTVDLCTDGIDNDEDGLADCEDRDGCSVGQPSINVTNPTCLDSLGRFRVNGQGGNILYSIDGGITYTEDSVFMDLPAGSYEVFAIRFGIEECMFRSPVTLSFPECLEDDVQLCGNGLDDDGDGQIDCADMDCIPFIDGVITMRPDFCPDLNDGSINIQSIYEDAEFSVDSGMTYLNSPLFEDLAEGDYYLFIRNPVTQCSSDFDNNPVILRAEVNCPAPTEDCSDGEDDDNDGLIDCLDPDCFGLQICEVSLDYYVPNVFLPLGQTNNTFGINTPTGHNLAIAEFSIFDRWGNQLYLAQNFSSEDPGHRWNGRYNGNIVEPGVYVYFISFVENARNILVSGDLTVIN